MAEPNDKSGVANEVPQYIKREKMNLSNLLEFGWEQGRRQEKVHFLAVPVPPLEWTDIYPSDETMQQMQSLPRPQDIRLCAIVYKCDKVFGYLSGIKLILTNGYETPMFQAEGAKESPENRVEVDPNAEIRQIRVWFDEFPDRNTYIHGLAMDGPEG